MKNIKDLREAVFQESTDLEDSRRLAMLARSGLFEPEKLNFVQRALQKSSGKLSKTERDVLLDLFDKLLSVVLGHQDAFLKVRQNVARGIAESSISDKDVDINNMPAILIMKRRAIRVFPDGQKVALYWVDKLNRYISVPFQSIGLSADVALKEAAISDVRYRQHAAARDAYDLARKIDPSDPTRATKILAAKRQLDVVKGQNYFTSKNNPKAGEDRWNTLEKNYDDRQAAIKQKNDQIANKRFNAGRRFSPAFNAAYQATLKFRAAAAQKKVKLAQAKLPISEIAPLLAIGAGALVGALSSGGGDGEGQVKNGPNNRPVVSRDPGQPSSQPSGVTKSFGQTDSHGRESDSTRKTKEKINTMAFKSRPGQGIVVESPASADKTAGERSGEANSSIQTKSTGTGTITFNPMIPGLNSVTEGAPLIIKYDDGNVVVNERQAQTLLGVYETLSETNKEKFVEMLNKDRKQFKKLLEFAEKG